jgi:hypothetical protein
MAAPKREIMMEQRKHPGSLVPWLVVATLVALIAAAVVYQRTRGSQASDAVVPTEGTASDSYEARRTARSVAMPAPRQPLTQEMVAERRQAMVAKRAEVQQRVDQTQAAFMSKYNTEPVDPAWAGGKEAALAQLATSPQMQEIGAEPKNLAVDCKSTMCKVTADFPSTSAGDDWFTLYMNSVGAQVPTASYKYVRNPDGSYSINVYAVGRR